MVIQKAIDNLKDKPKDDRKAVAGGIAIAVVAVLFFAWAFFFVKNLQNSKNLNLNNGAQSDFNFQSVKDAQQQLMQNYSGQSANDQELQAVRDQAAQQQYQQQAVQQSADQYQGADQFGSPSDSN